LVDRNGKDLDNTDDMGLAAGLDDLIARLKAAGKRVILIGPIAEPSYDIASNLSRRLAFGLPLTEPTFMSRDKFLETFGSVIGHYDSRADIVFIRPDLKQCAAGRCDYVIRGQVLFSDDNHLAQSALPLLTTDFVAAYAASQARH
jgi:hypothetical protein